MMYILLIIVFFIAIKFSQKINDSNTSPFLKPSENYSKEINYNLLNGHDFEYFCSDILKKNGFSNVRVTKGSGDFGVDILCSKDNLLYAIQCKKYASKVGSHAVQEVYSGKDYYNADVAVVLTNNYFTPAAVDIAEQLDVYLWDKKVLDKMINVTFNAYKKDNIDLKYTKIDNDFIHTGESISKHDNTKKLSDNLAEEFTPSINNKNTEDTVIMYDLENGIYPAGEYVIGEEIPLGQYILKQRDNSSSASIAMYKSYQAYQKDEDDSLSFKLFTTDYHISLRIEGQFLVVENADLQKIW